MTIILGSNKGKAALILLVIVVAGLIMPQEFSMPVEGATNADYHPDSFWYYPWGKSVTHKGVDVFAREGTDLKSATYGVVLFKGHINTGGNVVLVLGPKWRLHYYAHLDEINTSFLSLVNRNEKIGTVGTTGNAKGKPPHLHYSILSMIPYPWLADKDRQGWKKMFYLNPAEYIQTAKLVKL